MKKNPKTIDEIIINYYISIIKTGVKNMKNQYVLSKTDATKIHRLFVCRQILLEKSILTVNDKKRMIAINAEIIAIKTKYRSN